MQGWFRVVAPKRDRIPHHEECFLGARCFPGHQLPTGETGPVAPRALRPSPRPPIHRLWLSEQISSLEPVPLNATVEATPAPCSQALRTLGDCELWQDPEGEAQPQNSLGRELLSWVQRPSEQLLVKCLAFLWHSPRENTGVRLCKALTWLFTDLDPYPQLLSSYKRPVMLRDESTCGKGNTRGTGKSSVYHQGQVWQERWTMKGELEGMFGDEKTVL